jgi:hypothetical protein
MSLTDYFEATEGTGIPKDPKFWASQPHTIFHSQKN